MEVYTKDSTNRLVLGVDGIMKGSLPRAMNWTGGGHEWPRQSPGCGAVGRPGAKRQRGRKTRPQSCICGRGTPPVFCPGGGFRSLLRLLFCPGRHPPRIYGRYAPVVQAVARPGERNQHGLFPAVGRAGNGWGVPCRQGLQGWSGLSPAHGGRPPRLVTPVRVGRAGNSERPKGWPGGTPARLSGRRGLGAPLGPVNFQPAPTRGASMATTAPEPLPR
jgi:hypothetical protein